MYKLFNRDDIVKLSHYYEGTRENRRINQTLNYWKYDGQDEPDEIKGKLVTKYLHELLLTEKSLVLREFANLRDNVYEL